jgi:hypothetical protein
MDGLASRLSAAARRRPGSSSRGWPIYYPPAFFWWWYFYDAYAPRDLRRGRLYRGLGRLHRDRGRDRHVGLAGARGKERRDLWLGALGDEPER